MQLTNAGEIDEYYDYYDRIINAIISNENITNIDVLTNGYNTDKILTFIDKLKATRLDLEVGISFYSLNRDTYKKLTGVDALDHVIRTIKSVVCNKKRLQIIVFKETMNEVHDIINWALNEMCCSSVYLITNCYDMSIQKFTHDLYKRYNGNPKIEIEGYIQLVKNKELICNCI